MKVASENSDTVKPHVNKILHVQKNLQVLKNIYWVQEHIWGLRNHSL